MLPSSFFSHSVPIFWTRSRCLWYRPAKYIATGVAWQVSRDLGYFDWSTLPGWLRAVCSMLHACKFQRSSSCLWVASAGGIDHLMLISWPKTSLKMMWCWPVGSAPRSCRRFFCLCDWCHCLLLKRAWEIWHLSHYYQQVISNEEATYTVSEWRIIRFWSATSLTTTQPYVLQ